MLLILMYHQIANPDSKYGLKEFTKHLEYLRANFPIKTPGQPLEPNILNICLTFDDAYFDFYHLVYPLLQKFSVPVVLGIPTDYIKERNDAPAEQRLAGSYAIGLVQEMQLHNPLCSWEELIEMVDSGLVIPASHSASHADLTDPATNLEHELIFSKQTLAHKFSTMQDSAKLTLDNYPIDIVIFPYGKMSTWIQQKAREHYKYTMRIGNALNLNWDSRDGLLYRVDAEQFWHKNRPISSLFVQKALLKYWFNRLRGV